MFHFVPWVLVLLGSLAMAQPQPAAQVVAPTPQLPPPPPEWKPKLQWSGDLRYRLKSFKEDLDELRRLQQLRVRLGLRADVNEDTQAVLRLETATSALSGNQTLGEQTDPGMPRRSFGLDQAYIDWNYGTEGEVWAGRTANPFWQPGKTQLVFDADLAFEGVAVKFARAGGFVNMAGYIISENYTGKKDLVDQGIAGGDAGYALKMEESAWTSHIGYYKFLNVQNVAIKRFDKDAKIDDYTKSTPTPQYRGNFVVPDTSVSPPVDFYIENQFEIIELGTEWKQKLGPIEYSLWLDWLKNQKGGPLSTATESGAQIKWWRLTLAYAQMLRKANSVMGAFADDDFSGGGTDNKGTRISLSAQLGKSATLALTRYAGRRGIDTVTRNYDSTFVDFMVGF